MVKKHQKVFVGVWMTKNLSYYRKCSGRKIIQSLKLEQNSNKVTMSAPFSDYF